MTVYREGCGSHLAMLLHKAAGEDPCGTCRRGEALRRLSLEEIPTRPTRYVRQPATVAEVMALNPVSREEAAMHCEDLLAATEPVERRRWVRGIGGAA